MSPIETFYRAVIRWPDRPAVEDPAETVSYAQLAERVDALAYALQRRSAAGSMIGICAGNGLSHVVALLAVLASGRVWIPLNPRNPAAELERIVHLTRPALILSDQAYHGLFGQVSCPVIRTDGDGRNAGGHEDMQSLITAHAGWRPARNPYDRESIQAIKFTGGSTGIPKGVMQPARAWAACLHNQHHAYRFDETERFLLAAPLTHGASTFVLPILAAGGCLVVTRDTTPQTLLECLEVRAITATFMPPTMIYMVMEAAQDRTCRFPHLRHLVYAAAPMPTHKIRAAIRFFGPVLETSYGQTEAPTIVTAMSAAEFEDERNHASVGRAALTTEVAIMDLAGRLLPAGEQGEVVVRGDLVMSGYFELPDMTRKTLVDGWLHTGDVGVIDERGYLYLKARLREVIISGGFNVYPVDVEEALSRHPDVMECAAFGIAHERWGEVVTAAVRLRPGAPADEAALVAFAKTELGSVKAPKRVHFFDTLPRSPVGKVQKDRIRDSVLQKTGWPK